MKVIIVPYYKKDEDFYILLTKDMDLIFKEVQSKNLETAQNFIEKIFLKEFDISKWRMMGTYEEGKLYIVNIDEITIKNSEDFNFYTIKDVMKNCKCLFTLSIIPALFKKSWLNKGIDFYEFD